jgi:D-glycero-D-manno-heptose 1,7-bisphosphate phosphatase
MNHQTVIFLDKDGTLIEDVPYNVDPQKMVLAKGAACLRQLAQAGCSFVVVTNQSGVAQGYFEEDALKEVEARLGKCCGKKPG